jgi:hypothetical protein
VFGQALQAGGEPIGRGDVGVAENFESCAVVRGEHGLDEIGDGVMAEVGREIADAETTALDGARCGDRRGGGQWRGVKRVPAAVLGEDFFGRDVGEKIVREEEIAVGVRIRLLGEGGAVVRDGFGQTAGGAAEAAEIVVRGGEARALAEGFVERCFGFGGAACGEEGVAEDVVRFGTLGLED